MILVVVVLLAATERVVSDGKARIAAGGRWNSWRKKEEGMNNQYDRVIHIVNTYVYIYIRRALTGLVVVEWRLD